MIIFFNHQAERCGVYQFGEAVGNALTTHSKRNILRSHAQSRDEYFQTINTCRPEAVIFNYYPSTMPWLSNEILNSTPCPRICIVHENCQGIVDRLSQLYTGFTHYLCPDPTLEVDNHHVFKTGRIVPPFAPIYTPVSDTGKNIIGSFGFGFGNKGYLRLIDTVQSEFDEAIIRLHIPYAQFGDATGEQARARVEECRARIIKPGIDLRCYHGFLSTTDLLFWLAGNDINVFFYDRMDGRGIASTTDYALAVHRPIAITKSVMFRHLWDESICIEDHSLKSILERGDIFGPYRDKWSPRSVAAEYDAMLDSVLAR